MMETVDQSGLPRAALRGWAWALLALLQLLPFATRPSLIGGDEPHYALAAHSLAVDGDLALADDYADVSRGAPAAGKKRAGQTLDPHLRRIGEHEHFAHPAGLPLLAAPWLAVQQGLVPGAAPDLLLGLLVLGVTFAGLAAGLRLLGVWVGDAERGAWLGIAAYLSSPLWFYSRVFMTEGFTWAFAVLAIERIHRRRLASATLFLALALAMKETALLLVGPILVASALVLGARAGIVLAAGPFVAALAWVARNVSSGLPAWTTFQPFQWGDLSAGALGLLFDPAHGWLWFTPLLGVGLAGVFALRRLPVMPARSLVVVAALGAFAGYFAVSAAWIDWRGGACFGPRLLVPVLPALVLPLAALAGPRVPRWARLVLAAAFLLGFTVQWCAALDPVPAFWSATVPELLRAKLGATASGLLVGGALARSIRARLGWGGPPASSTEESERT